MFYEQLQRKDTCSNWPETRHYVRAKRTKNGEEVRIPIQPLNVLVTGTTRYGKTVFTKKYVKGVLESDPDTFAVFFQIKPDDFTEEFLRPQDKIITFNGSICSAQNLFKWNMVKEIRSYPREKWEEKLENLLSAMFEDILSDPRNITWANGAKETFKMFLRVILYKYSNNPPNRTIIQDMTRMGWNAMLKFLWQYAPNRSALKDNFEYDGPTEKTYKLNKKGSDIAFFLQYVTGKFGGTFLSDDGEDTIYDYLHGKYGQGARLFFLHDHEARESLKMFEKILLKQIIDSMMSLASDYKIHMLMVLDEIDKVGYDIGLTEAATLGLQFGLQIIVSTQSINSLYAIASKENGKELMDAALAGFPMTVTFHPGNPYTIETFQKLYGKTRKQVTTMMFSRYDKPSVTTEECFLVEDSDFASLDVGEAYVKYRSFKPERVKIII